MGRHNLLGSILSENYENCRKTKSKEGKKFKNSFCEAKGDKFIRGIFMKTWLKEHELGHLYEPEAIASLIALRNNKAISSAKRTDMVRELLRANPLISSAIIHSCTSSQNWETKLLQCLNIKFILKHDIKQESICMEFLVNMIHAYINVGINQESLLNEFRARMTKLHTSDDMDKSTTFVGNEISEHEISSDENYGLEAIDNGESLEIQSNLPQSDTSCNESEAESEDNPLIGILIKSAWKTDSGAPDNKKTLFLQTLKDI